MGDGGIAVPFYLHRESPLHAWHAYADGNATGGYQAGRPHGGEIIPLPHAYFWLQAVEECERRNGKGGVEQEALGL